ncbi:YitT family protein [Alicyclobacillus ferrooxydans]|uniref:DUF2179 domain-containing protein n=1 Tax=Alicyclobacillus ferrooxydans TaxID=471514 RepID=A0A0P9GIQ1_9BACL|nr:YitT family protein [Alicyclobacillus ferrooxydans]KPV39903.1 hypothetical protein AN477_22060 [Alicyclobacillus ferrooxydans]
MPSFDSNQLNINYFLRTSRHPVLNVGVRIIVLLFACVLSAVAINSFLVPARILAGGVTGIAQIIHHFWSLPIGTMYFIFNIPLFILGFRYLGKQFIFLTGVGIVGFSVFTDTIHPHFNLPVQDPLLMSLYGGVLGGVASGLVFRVGGSTGGTDILSLVFNRITGRSVGSLSFGMNVIIVILSMTVFGIPAGLYTLVSMFATSRVVNALLNYQNRKTALIVSVKATEIGEAIGQQLGRGSTLLQASGAYSKANTNLLICALTHLELTELRQLCTAIDPNVFVTVLPTTEVYGRFRHVPD